MAKDNEIPVPSNVKMRRATPRASNVQMLEGGRRGSATTKVLMVPKDSASLPVGPGVQMFRKGEDGKMVAIDSDGNPLPTKSEASAAAERPASAPTAPPANDGAIVPPQTGELARVTAGAADAADDAAKAGLL